MFFLTKKLLTFLSSSFTVITLFGFAVFYTTPTSLAQTGGVTFIQDVQLNYEIPGIEGRKINVTSIQRLQETFIKPFFNTLFGIGGIIAVMGIALGGLQYMGAGASIGNVKEGQAKIFNAIMGVVLLLSSFLLLRTINPQILGGVGTNKECKDGGQLEHPERAQNNSLCPIPKITQSQVDTVDKAIDQNRRVLETNLDEYAKQRLKDSGSDINKAVKATVDRVSALRIKISQDNAALDAAQASGDNTEYIRLRTLLQQHQFDLKREVATLKTLQERQTK